MINHEYYQKLSIIKKKYQLEKINENMRYKNKKKNSNPILSPNKEF
jgi:hypothetical protein